MRISDWSSDVCSSDLQPRAGRVLVDGTPLSEVDLQAWRSLVGYVPQELILFHDSVLANVTLGDPRLGEAEAREALEAAGAWDFVAALPEGVHSVVGRSEEHTSELQSLMRISYAVFCLKKKTKLTIRQTKTHQHPSRYRYNT